MMRTIANRFKSKEVLWVGLGALGFVIAYLITATSLQLFPFQQQPSRQNDPIRMQVTGFANHHRPEEALPFADLVVLAEITEIGAARWNTKGGQRPVDWSFEKSFPEWMIYTPFSFKISTILLGETQAELVTTFAVAGGQAGNDIIDAAESINLYTDVTVGDQMILFLEQSTGNLVNVAPYTYIDALRIDGNNVTAECRGSRLAQECDIKFELSNVLTKVEAAKQIRE